MNPQTKDEKRVEMSLNDYLELLNENKTLKAKLTQTKTPLQESRETWFLRFVTWGVIIGMVFGMIVLAAINR